MVAPSVIALFIWMIVPLALTLWFSTLRYTFYDPLTPFVGIETDFLTDPRFISAFQNTLIPVGGVLDITVIGGTLIALLLDQQFFGQSPVRLLVLAPFFVRPTVEWLIPLRRPTPVRWWPPCSVERGDGGAAPCAHRTRSGTFRRGQVKEKAGAARGERGG